MGYVLVTDTELGDIGDAIRSKTGENSTLTLSQMASAIGELGDGEGGGSSNIILLEPVHFDLHSGYVNTGTWTVQSSNQDTYCDVYSVLNGHKYLIFIGAVVSTRFRVMFSTTDPASFTGSQMSGAVVGSDINDPVAYTIQATKFNSSIDTIYSPSSDGYLTIGKSNNNTPGIITYVLDVTNLFISQ